MIQASALAKLYFIIFSSLLLLSACATAPELDQQEEPSVSPDASVESSVGTYRAH